MNIFDISFFLCEKTQALSILQTVTSYYWSARCFMFLKPLFYVHVRGGKCIFDGSERINMLIHTLHVEGDLSHF